MIVALDTVAERNAKKAEDLPAFGGLKLLNIKNHVASLLALIGRDGIFDQYTKHDISHINTMLSSLDWIIPAATKKTMSPADWLMVVLAIYFHDLGMLVTKDEFNARDSSGFPGFCDTVLFGGPHGADYKAQLSHLDPGERSRFLYQEFVRHKHAARVRAWIMGQTRDELGIANAVVAEIDRLFSSLDAQFRRDLGLVCESHHLEDLADTRKYKVSQPYGNSDDETANLQYCAVLLRTADLLHITSDRTPSIEFRTINPSDPISQDEWAKQMAVRRIRPKPNVNEDGVIDESTPSGTVEVHAYFNKEDGFFGLTSYLVYAADQLKKSNEWITATLKSKAAKHDFPWRRIDDTNIETQGFIRQAFEFTLDQNRILDLLTGHTLYNNTNVVLRELLQNAIDAIRLQYFPNSPLGQGKIFISWNSVARTLTVRDNGTGMTQDIINNFLLKVGSSRYQDANFKKFYPNFSSISRFGIGVLSAFMVADSVEITTCHEDDEYARRLTLRSVHGKYLIRLLDKTSDEARRIGPHGTVVQLRVRPSVEMPDVLRSAKRWVVVPGCDVYCSIDNAESQQIGFRSPADGLRDYLRSVDFSFFEGHDGEPELGRARVRIVERTREGLDLAYAVVWNNYFKEWSFLSVSQTLQNANDYSDDLDLSEENDGESLLLGTCIEGIRIVTDTPGFIGHSIVGLANIKGPGAPRTNVARSGLEATPEREAMLRSIYALYAEHVSEEVGELNRKRSFSSTWAIAEAPFLTEPLLAGTIRNVRAIAPSLLFESLRNIPCIMVEQKGNLGPKTLNDISKEPEFWMIDSGLMRSAESLMREVTTTASLTALVDALKVGDFEFPAAPVVCGRRSDNDILNGMFASREVDQIIVFPNQRRVDLRWVEKSNPPRWLELPAETQRMAFRFFRERRRRSTTSGLCNVPRVGVNIKTTIPSGELAVRAFNELYLLPGTKLAEFAAKQIERMTEEPSFENEIIVLVLLNMLSDFFLSSRGPTNSEAVVNYFRLREREIAHMTNHKLEELFDILAFTNIAVEMDWTCFDPSAWSRASGS